MSKKSYLFLLIAAVLLAILAGFFASTHPDGLEKVARKLGFEQKAKDTPAVFVDYQLSSIPLPAVSSAAAGIFGIILIIFIFKSISKAHFIGEILQNLLNREKPR